MFALLRLGEGTLGLLMQDLSGWAQEQCGSIHFELSTDHFNGLYEELHARGIHFHEPPHDEPWERTMVTLMILTDIPLSSHWGGGVRTHQVDGATTSDEKEAEGQHNCELQGLA